MQVIDKFVNYQGRAKRQVFATLLSAMVLMGLGLPAHAIELGVNLFQTDESKSKAFSLAISDNFTRRGNVYWTIAYNKADKIFVEWNNSELDFPLESVELGLSYRTRFRQPSMRKLNFEFQAGVAASLTDNKFFWPDLNEQKYFSETGDTAAFVAISARYNLTSNASTQLGLKHFPSYYEFGSLSAVFLGFSYRFGQTYYGH